MENYVLSCCSTMDLRKGWAEEHGVNLIYAKFFLEEEEFSDDFYESISQEKLFERMLSGEKSQTTQVNTEEYIGSFRKYLEQGQDILHICLSSGVSGTFNSCNIAKDILLEEFPERKIEIVDSLMASCGYGLLVDKACELKKQGLDMYSLRNEVEKWRNRLHGYFFTSDLRFFIQGGRVSKAAGFIGGLLKRQEEKSRLWRIFSLKWRRRDISHLKNVSSVTLPALRMQRSLRIVLKNVFLQREELKFLISEGQLPAIPVPERYPAFSLEKRRNKVPF